MLIDLLTVCQQPVVIVRTPERLRMIILADVRLILVCSVVRCDASRPQQRCVSPGTLMSGPEKAGEATLSPEPYAFWPTA